MTLKCKLLRPDAKLPTRGSEGAAGYDLYAVEERHVYRHGLPVRVPTGVAIEIPPGYVGLVCPESGLTANHNVTVANAPGVVDEDYRGEAVVMLTSHGEYYAVKPGDRVGQLVVVKYEALPVEIVEELSPSGRGTGGFGSTGK